MADLNNALDIYQKESSIEGIGACLYLFSSIYFILYLQTLKYDYLIESGKRLQKVNEIANICKSGKFLNLIVEEEEWKRKISGV